MCVRVCVGTRIKNKEKYAVHRTCESELWLLDDAQLSSPSPSELVFVRVPYPVRIRRQLR